MSNKEQLALRVIELAKTAVLADNHFLGWAIGRLHVAPAQLEASFGTDGYVLAFDPDRLLSRFKRTGLPPKRNLLHSVAHCLFLHPYVSASVNRPLWDLACDIAAERVVADLLGPFPGEKGARMSVAFARIENDLGTRISAEGVYRRLREGLWADQAGEWSALMKSDTHELWYKPASSSDAEQGEGVGEGTDPAGGIGSVEGDSQSFWSHESESEDRDDSLEQPQQTNAGANPPKGQEANEEGTSPSSANGADEPSDQSGQSQQLAQGNAGAGELPTATDAAGNALGSIKQAAKHGEGPGNDVTSIQAPSSHLNLRQIGRSSVRQQKDEWRHVATSLAVNLQTLSAKRGESLAGFVDDLTDAARTRVDYARFLRQFAIPGEVMRLSEDEFDNVFYTYGLELYGNIPLIEPLEYREEKRVREFVIVIDTSASVKGDIVRRFVATTFDLLKQTEAFFQQIHVRILQCDAQVRTDDCVTSPSELEQWGRSMRVVGGGGTDFRPAFDYVDELVAQKAFHDLGGLLYFTDGHGTYPQRMPSYRCAFVFWRDAPPDADVPPWAVQIALDEELQAIGAHAKQR
ncbi:MAG: hypothetical protein IJI68_11660 [Eggerthellaceae bacterium]|nr:hypothetical protein [Eggerthellaceae bacterium]